MNTARQPRQPEQFLIPNPSLSTFLHIIPCGQWSSCREQGLGRKGLGCTYWKLIRILSISESNRLTAKHNCHLDCMFQANQNRHVSYIAFPLHTHCMFICVDRYTWTRSYFRGVTGEHHGEQTRKHSNLLSNKEPAPARVYQHQPVVCELLTLCRKNFISPSEYEGTFIKAGTVGQEGLRWG